MSVSRYEVLDFHGHLHTVEADDVLDDNKGCCFYKVVTKTSEEPRFMRKPKVYSFQALEKVAYFRDPVWVVKIKE